MYAEDFVYHRATSLADAHRLLADHPGAKLLAGGHSLIPLLKLRLTAPPAVIDIGRLPELQGIAAAGDTIRIGALSTHAELAASPIVRSAAPALADAAGLVGDPAVRNRGTIGGNIAHADPASDLPPVLVALDAQIVAAGPHGERTVPAEAFFTGLMATALDADEVVAAVLVPDLLLSRGSAYVKFAHPASRYAVVGVAAAMTRADGTCKVARVALGGLVPSARRAAAVEQALSGTRADPPAIAEAAARAGADLGEEVTGDIYASAEYRAAIAPVYIERALALAGARAGTV